jgi:hypothetical protein
LHHLDVTAYLTDVLRRLPAVMPTDATAIGELLPDRWAQAHPEKNPRKSEIGFDF